MGLKCGIVGLPNVGKSTLFNAITKAEIAAENYPFCTIEPNVGIVEVPDPRLQKLADIVSPERVLPATVEFVDIAGLVAGASQGEGLGNKFLAHIRECDAIAHVVRCFEDSDVIHVNGKVDPLDDIEIINTELALADLAVASKALEKHMKPARAGDKEAQRYVDVLEKVVAVLDQAKPVRSMDLSKEEKVIVDEFFLITAKPTMYVGNIPDSGVQGNEPLKKVQELADSEKSIVVPVCAAIEAQIADLDAEDKSVFLEDMGMSEPGLDRVIRGAFELLGLQTYFTAGEKEVRAWTVRTGATAPQAAGVIHTDFEHGFIRAETIAYNDYVDLGGEAGARDKGKMRLEGKEYILKDGDVMHFRFNV